MPGLVPLLRPLPVCGYCAKKLTRCGSSLLLRHRYRWLRLRPAGTVRLFTLPGPFGPVFFIWRINDNHDLVLILFIAALLAFAIYDQFSCPAVTAPLCWQFLCSGVVAR